MLQQYHETFLRIKFKLVYMGKLIGLGLGSQILFFFSAIFALKLKLPHEQFLIVQAWIVTIIKNFFLGFFHKPLIEYDPAMVIHAIITVAKSVKLPFLISLLGWLIPYFMHKWLKNKDTKALKEHQVAGSEIIPVLKFIKQLRKKPSKLKIGGLQEGFTLIDEDKLAAKQNKKEENEFRKGIVPIPTESELRHFFIVGRSGSGKTVLLNPTIQQLKIRQEKILIHDFKGDMVTKFYNPITDFIFNPLDRRCLKWNIWNDIEDEIDIRSIASSLFQTTIKEDPFWNDAAKDIFEGILIYLYNQELKTNKAIYEYINKPAGEILTILKNDPDTAAAARYISDPNSKQTQGVLSKLTQNTKCFKYLKDIDGNFSIKEWIEYKKDSTIFLVNYADIKDTIAPVLSVFVDIAARTTLSLQDDLNRRIFFFLDEFGQLNKMNSLVDILTNGRSKGASIWLAIQDIGQIDEKYGVNIRKTIVNAFSNYIVFAANDYDTAKFFVNKIGERKVVVTDEMLRHDSEAEDDNLGIRKTQKTENLILASDVMNMRDREAFIKVSEIQQYSKIKVYLKPIANVVNRIER